MLCDKKIIENVKMPLVSIIMPTYNRKNIIKRAIDSCSRQSYENIEIVVCDDHSTDGTEEYIQELRKEETRIVYCKTPPGHKGANAARNEGIRIAKGKYICFLDSDDEILENGIIDRVELFEQNPKAGMVYGNAVCQKGNKRNPWIYRKVPATFREARKDMLKELSLCIQSTIMVRTQVFAKIGLLNEEQKGWTDDGLVVAVGLRYPVLHSGKFIAIIHKSEECMTGNKWNLYQGLCVMLARYKKEIISEVSIWRYFLWKIRLLSEFCYAKETTSKSRLQQNVWKKLHQGLRWFWRKYFINGFE